MPTLFAGRRANKAELTFVATLLTATAFPMNASEDSELNALLEMDLESLAKLTFTTASRVEVPFDETIGTSYIVTRDMIRKRGYQSLKDVLQHIPGFIVNHRDIQYVAGVRGLSSNDNLKTTLMINGYEINGVHEPDFLNGPINLDNAERVEIIVGPSSFFEQASTLAATVNVITRNVDGAAITLTRGNDIDHRESLEAGQRSDTDRWINASLVTEQRKGYDAFELATSPAFQHQAVGEKRAGQSDEQHHVVINGQYDNFSAQLQFFKTAPAHPVHPTFNVEKIHSLSLKYSHPVSDGRDRFFTLRAISKSQKETDTPYVQSSDLYKAEWGEIYSTEQHVLQYGLQYSYDDYDRFTDRSDQAHVMVVGESHAFGVYLSDTWTISDKLKINTAIRADRSQVLPNNDWYPGGRFALIYNSGDDWLSKFMVNHVVKMPTALAARNIYWGSEANHPAAPSWAKENPIADRPEQLTTVEWQNILYFDERKLRASLTLYNQYLRDFVSWGNPYTNIGDFEGYGVEGDLLYRVNDKADLWVNFSYVDSTLDFSFDKEKHAVSDDDGKTVGSPDLTINFGGEVALIDTLFFSPSVRYITGQSYYDIPSGEYDKIDDLYYLDASLLWNNAFSIENMDLRLRVQNILNNEDPRATTWFQGTHNSRGTTANISLSYEF